MVQAKPRKPHTKLFQKGRAKTGGRKKGVPNKSTIGMLEVRQAIWDKLARHGSDGKGKDGIDGTVDFIFAKERKIFVQGMFRMMPVELHANVRGTMVEITANLSEKEAAEAYGAMLEDRSAFVDAERKEDGSFAVPTK